MPPLLNFLNESSQTIVEQGGVQPGGLNFDAKVRRESTDPEDLFIAHIGAMDAFARGLRNAVHIIEEGLLAGMVKVRIKSVTLFQPCCCNTCHSTRGRQEPCTCSFATTIMLLTRCIIPSVWKQERYSSFSHGIGQKVEDGSATLEEMEVCF